MSNKQKFLDVVFQRFEDYPIIGNEETILPLNTCWNYVTSSFLNGFVNSVSDEKPIAAAVVNKYRKLDHVLKFDPSQQEDLCNTGVSFKPSATKQEVFDLVSSGLKFAHTPLSMFQDDVALLIKSPLMDSFTENQVYWFFWFDFDVSDCSIGRFATVAKTEEQLIELFYEYVDEISKDRTNTEAFRLPKDFLSGWMKF